MASMNSSVLACMNYTISLIGSADLNPKLAPMPSSISLPASMSSRKLSVIRTQIANDQSQYSKEAAKRNEGRRAALVFLAAGTLFAAGATASTARAGVIEDYLERSKSNKELNDKKRLATSGANFARAFTVQFGSCKFPENFTGCQDLAKQKKVPFLSEDLDLECKGKDKFRCGSNVFWKW